MAKRAKAKTVEDLEFEPRGLHVSSEGNSQAYRRGCHWRCLCRRLNPARSIVGIRRSDGDIGGGPDRCRRLRRTR